MKRRNGTSRLVVEARSGARCFTRLSAPCSAVTGYYPRMSFGHTRPSVWACDASAISHTQDHLLIQHRRQRRYASLCVAVLLGVALMFKLMAWLGIYVGTPSVATYVTLSYQDHFVVFFVLFVGVVLLAILPLLGNPTRH